MKTFNCEKISLINLLSITCPSCKTSKGVGWHSAIETPNEIVDGCFRSHDIKPIFFAACEYCSETIKIVNSDEIAFMLTTFTDSLVASEVNADKALAIARKEQRHACAVIRPYKSDEKHYGYFIIKNNAKRFSYLSC